MSDSAIVGRESELAALGEFLGRVRDGACGVLLDGEPGIGKSTLWEAAVSEAGSRSMRVLVARPRAPEAGLSFSALGDLVEGDALEPLDELAPPRGRALRVALLLEEPGPRPPPEERAVALAVHDLLRVLAGSAPVVLAIDDVQWLDRSSASVIAFAWRRLRGDRVGLLLASRVAEPEALTEDARISRIAVGPLSAGGVQRLLRTRLGATFARPTLLRLHRSSGGNPFYALEFGRLLGSAGAVSPGAPLPMPRTLAAVVEARLASLPGTVRETLAAAAACVDPTVPLLDSVAGGAARAPGRLRRAALAGVVAVDEGGRVRFTHPLFAAGIYGGTAAETRRRIHRRLANVTVDPEERARHLALAVDGTDAAAATALDEAAAHAFARGAVASAAELAELAVRLTPSSDSVALLRRRLLASDFHHSAGAPDRARALLEPLLGDATTGGDRADVLERLARLSRTMDEYLELCERGLLAAAGDDGRLSRMNWLLAGTWPRGGGSRHALRYSKRALLHADRSGDRRLRAAATARVALMETWAGRSTPGLLARGVALERSGDRLWFYESPRLVRALLRLYQGRLDEARSAFEAALDETAAAGDEVGSVELRGRLVELELRAGDWQRASVHQSVADELGEQIGLEHLGRATLFRKAMLEAHLGNVDAARAAAERGAELSEDSQLATYRLLNLGALGFLELSRGDAAAADVYLRPSVDWLLELDLALVPFPVGAYALEALIEVGELEQARRLVARFATESRALASPWGRALEAYLRGRLEAAAGDLPASLRFLVRALDQHEGAGWPFERARTLLALGELQRRTKQKLAARQSLTTALATFDELGAAIWSARTRGALARISGRTRGGDELTATEQRVADLVAAGRTNREVASALFIATRTVEWNLSKIYAKLGLRSRSELARRLAER